MCQTIQIKQLESDESVDWDRMKRFGLVGATLHGPFYLSGFHVADRIVGIVSWVSQLRRFDVFLALDRMKGRIMSNAFAKVFAKTAIMQFSFFPIYLVIFFQYMGVLEGLTWREAYEKKVKPCVPISYWTGCFFMFFVLLVVNLFS